MAKGTTFAEKTKRGGKTSLKMARIVVSELKPNGHYSFKNRMVPLADVKGVIKAAKAK